MVFGGETPVSIFGLNLSRETKLGLDLKGGYEITLQARQANVSKDQMNGARGIIEKRVSGLGTNEPVVRLVGDNRIGVELPGVTDEDQVKSVIGSTGRLEFIDAGSDDLQTGQLVKTTYCTTGSLYSSVPGTCGNVKPQIVPNFIPTITTPATTTAAATTAAATNAAGTPVPTTSASTTPTPSATETPDPTAKVYQTIITGNELDPAKIDKGFNSTSGAAQVNFGIRADAANTFYNFTSAGIGKNMAIVLDGRVLSSAVIRAAIRDSGQITNDTQWGTTQGKLEVDGIVLNLKYGALPVELDILQSRKIGATLGQDSIDRSYIAGAVGLSIVALFMLLYFRLPGLIADLALVVYAVLTFAIFKLIGVVLTLAGIAGFILSIGIAVDANILIFARMKEELRQGRSIERAVEAGFRNAWLSIRDSNMSGIITCIILYWFGDFTGTSVIKGFAITLALGIFVSLFSAIVVTHTFLRTMFIFTGNTSLVRNTYWYGLNRLANRVAKPSADLPLPVADELAEEETKSKPRK
jgi:preprotein translocase subunit SecD